MPIEVKKDPYVWGAFGLIILVTAGFVWHGDMTVREWIALVTGGALIPAIFGRRNPPNDPGAGQTPLLVEELIPVSHVQPSTPPPAARFACACAFLLACSQPLTPQQKSELADGTYAAEQMKCVTDGKAKGQTRTEVDACRKEKRDTWDAGAEGGAK